MGWFYFGRQSRRRIAESQRGNCNAQLHEVNEFRKVSDMVMVLKLTGRPEKVLGEIPLAVFPQVRSLMLDIETRAGAFLREHQAAR